MRLLTRTLFRQGTANTAHALQYPSYTFERDIPQ